MKIITLPRRPFPHRDLLARVIRTGVVLRDDESSHDGDSISISKFTSREGDKENGEGGVTGDNADPWLAFDVGSDFTSALPRKIL